MRIFTQSIAFVTNHDHRPSVVSFLSCLRYIFNSSVIPEILSNDKNIFKLVLTYRNNEISWYRLFARSHTMQFSSSLIIPGSFDFSSSVSSKSDGFVQEILLPLKNHMRYFSCTLQRCVIVSRDLRGDKEGILALLADVRSLVHLEFHSCSKVNINTFLSLFLASSCRNQLEHLSIALSQDYNECLDGIEGCFQRLRFLRLSNTDNEVALKLIKRCPHLRTLIIKECSWVSLDEICELVPRLTTLEVNHVNYDVSHLSTLCDKLPELTSLDVVSAYGEDSQLENIEFLRDKPWMHDNLQMLKVRLSVEERITTDEQPKKHDWVKDCLSHFRNLTQLHLSDFGEQLNDENFRHLAHLGFLRQFYMFRGEVTSEGLFDLALLACVGNNNNNTFFTNLETFEISSCKLGGTNESPQHLLKFFSCCTTNKLKVLKLFANDLSDADLTPDLAAEWKRCGVKKLWLGGCNNKLYYDNDDHEKKNGLVNLSQLTSITSLRISHLDNVQGLDFLANMQQLRELDASNLPILKSSAIKVFSPRHNAQNLFQHLRKLYLAYSCRCSVPADEVIDRLLENENIKLRLENLDLEGMSFSEGYDIQLDQFKGANNFNFELKILKT